MLATKFFMPMGEDPNQRGGSRRWIIRAVEDSLRRLGTDHIDLYQVHRPDPARDVEETLGALTDLVRQGKVRYIGSSSYSGSQIVEAQWAARERGLERFRTEQPPYSLLVRGIELDVLPTAQRHGMGILTYSPLAGGWLSGSWSADSSPTSPARQRLAARFDMSLPENQRKLEAVEQLATVADDAGLTHDRAGDRVRRQPPGGHLRRSSARARWSSSRASCPPPTRALDAAVLDRIDEIVKPGVNLNPADTSYGEQVLAAGAPAPLGHHPHVLREVLAGQRRPGGDEVGRRALEHDPAAVVAGARAEVDDPVGVRHDRLVVLDDDDRLAGVDEPVEQAEQLLDVGEVQAGGRLVEHVDVALLAQVGGQLEPLALAAGQRR